LVRIAIGRDNRYPNSLIYLKNQDMKKTISVNISGLVFNIEEEAYSALDQYLKDISARIKNSEDAKEIIRDVESRIAELFREKLSNTSEVITVEHVEEVKAILGKPADFSMEEGENQTSENNFTSEEKTSSEKRMYRDTDNAKLGGVCSGIAAYFGVDAIIIRILFVFLFIVGGSGVLLYLILLFIIPEAKTTADKLRMRGEPVNVNNIKDHFNTIKDDLSKKAKNSSFVETFNDLIASLPPFVTKTLKVISQVVGFFFITGSLVALFVFTSMFMGESGFLPIHIDGQDLTLSDGISLLFGDGIHYSLSYLAILVFIYIPIITFSIWGVKLLFTIQTKTRVTSIVLGVVWSVSIAILMYTGISVGMDMSKQEQVIQTIAPTVDTNKLFVDVDIEGNLSDAPIEVKGKLRDFILIKNESFYLGNPQLVLKPNEKDSVFKIEIIKEAAAGTSKMAYNRAERISYNHLLWGNQLKLSPYLKMNVLDKLRGQTVTVIIYVPEGKEVEFGENIDHVFHDLNDTHHNDNNEISYKNTVFINKNNNVEEK
jgi:phage shock protein PspC (stress-responsive transcriptional regulator)